MLKLLLGATLFLTLFLTVIGWVGFGETKFSIFTYVGSISLVMNLLWLLAIIAIFRYFSYITFIEWSKTYHTPISPI